MFQGSDQKLSNASSWSSLAQSGQVGLGSAMQPAPNLLKSTDDSFQAFKKQAKEQLKKVSSVSFNDIHISFSFTLSYF